MVCESHRIFWTKFSTNHKLFMQQKKFTVHPTEFWQATNHSMFCVFVFHPKVSKFGHFFDRTFSIKPPNIQIRSRVADPHKRGIEFKYLSSPFCPTAAEILHQPPSLPPHPPPICLTPIFLQFKGWTLLKLQNSAPPKYSRSKVNG